MGRIAGRIQEVLKKWLYGMRKSALGWEDDFARRLVNDGCQFGSAVSTLSLPLFSPIAVLFLFTLPTLYNSIEHAHQTRHSILTGLLH